MNLSFTKRMLWKFLLGSTMGVALVSTGCATPLHALKFEAGVPVGQQPEHVRSANLSANLPVADTSAEATQRKVSYRYSQDTVSNVLRSTSLQTAVNVYREASDLADSRHIAPSNYDDRTQFGLRSVSAALKNPTFLAKTGRNLTVAQTAELTAQLDGWIPTIHAQSRANGEQTLVWVANLVERRVGVPAGMVGMEFVHGMIESLDKYSSLEVKATASGRSAAAGDTIVGIGVELKEEATGARVVRPLQGGPAEMAGLKKGDIILAVNGQSLSGMSLGEMANLIGGPQGSRILLQVQMETGATNLLSVTRDKIEIKSLSEARMIDDVTKTAYIRIDRFAEDTTTALDKALWKLHGEGMQNLVIDVRGNPGGLLTAAVAISDRFLTSGTVVATKGRTTSDNSRESATYANTWKTPLVVLVDENSASASEIFAAAIQENGRGVIVGRKSYGKGTVQTHFPLRTVSANLKLTTAKFYSPNGNEMANRGVTPDVVVDYDLVAGQTLDLDIAKALDVTRDGSTRALVANLINAGGPRG